jgi:peroxiredoxin
VDKQALPRQIFARRAAGVLGLLSFLLASCARESTPAALNSDPVGVWRGTLSVPGGELPFGLEFERASAGLAATFINGAKRSRVDEIEVSGVRLLLRIPGYAHRIEAEVQGDLIVGEYVAVGVEGKESRIPLAAKRGLTHRFFASPLADNAQFAGRWATEFTDASGKTSPAVGEFEQTGTSITGTFLTGTGDHGFLAGDVRGNEMYLSSFNGGQAVLYRARLTGADTLQGEVWSGAVSRRAFVARRDANANLGDAERKTQLRSDNARFDFRFPDVDGKPVALSDPRFAGKVVIVTLAGSWCPNCHDEAEFLGPLYQRYRAQGLEVLALMFEHFEDFARAAAATRRFNADRGLEYTALIAGISNKDSASSKLPQLNGVYAYPTTIFIDRRGQVRDIHTGFAGPGTGEHYTRLTQNFERQVQDLLAEKS